MTDGSAGRNLTKDRLQTVITRWAAIPLQNSLSLNVEQKYTLPYIVVFRVFSSSVFSGLFCASQWRAEAYYARSLSYVLCIMLLVKPSVAVIENCGIEIRSPFHSRKFWWILTQTQTELQRFCGRFVYQNIFSQDGYGLN